MEGFIADIENLYMEEFDRMVKRASFRLGGIPHAEDAVQEAFSRALKYSPSFDPRKKELGAWFNTILNNSIRDFKRDIRMEGMVTEEEPGESLEDLIFRDEMLELVSKESAKLSKKKQDVLDLSLVFRYTAKEISQVLPLPQHFVNTTLRDFRKNMGEMYGKDMLS